MLKVILQDQTYKKSQQRFQKWRVQSGFSIGGH